MSVKIGIDLSRNKERKPGKIGGGVWLFQIMNLRKDGKAHSSSSERSICVATICSVSARAAGRSTCGCWACSGSPRTSHPLAKETISTVTSIGKFSASPDVKRAFAGH